MIVLWHSVQSIFNKAQCLAGGTDHRLLAIHYMPAGVCFCMTAPGIKENPSLKHQFWWNRLPFPGRWNWGRAGSDSRGIRMGMKEREIEWERKGACLPRDIPPSGSPPAGWPLWVTQGSGTRPTPLSPLAARWLIVPMPQGHWPLLGQQLVPAGVPKLLGGYKGTANIL